MSSRPDYEALISGQAAAIEMVDSGQSVLPALDRILEVAQRALGAVGMTFTEVGSERGRVVCATGGARWALGRPVDLRDPTVAGLLRGTRVREFCVDALPPEMARQLAGRELRRVLCARAEVGALVIGSVQALYPDCQGSTGPEYHTALGYLAACIAHLYADHAGLPVRGGSTTATVTSEGLAVIDREGLVRLWNPAAERITGSPAVHMLHHPLPFPIPPAGQTLDHRLPDGRWLRLASGELPEAAGARVVTLRETTGQHPQDPDRDLFVAVTSHELRTPVTVIKGYADTLNTHWSSLSEFDRREAARVIHLRAAELARLVDRLLLTTSDAGPVGGSPPVPFDLAEALQAAAAGLPADLRRRLAVRLPAELPKALGDRASLATVLTELATNAEKYSGPGAPFELSAHADERTVFFRVSDRGVGVRPEHVERAFDRFWQGESGDRRRYAGAGLGLYLVRQIVERQGGWVSLRPRDGGGTVAEVRLPRS